MKHIENYIQQFTQNRQIKWRDWIQFQKWCFTYKADIKFDFTKSSSLDVECSIKCLFSSTTLSFLVVDMNLIEMLTYIHGVAKST